jgi:hypothetical protein
MAKLPSKLLKLLEKNKNLINEKLGEAFYNRMLLGDVVPLDISKITEVIRAAALQQ